MGNLSKFDLRNIEGGSFAKDLGTAIRFVGIYFWSGYASAVADYGYNATKCN